MLFDEMKKPLIQARARVGGEFSLCLLTTQAGAHVTHYPQDMTSRESHTVYTGNDLLRMRRALDAYCDWREAQRPPGMAVAAE